MTVRGITCDRLRRLLDERVPPQIIDVRSKEEFDEFHLQGSHHIPLEDLEVRGAEIDPMVDAVIVSEHGIRSLRVCEQLVARGYPKVVNLLGGVAEFRFHHG